MLESRVDTWPKRVGGLIIFSIFLPVRTGGRLPRDPYVAARAARLGGVSLGARGGATGGYIVAETRNSVVESSTAVTALLGAQEVWLWRHLKW